MRRSIVAGNWKMNGARAEARRLVAAVLDGLPPAPKTEVILCPPFVLLDEVNGQISRSTVRLGAQNCSAEKQGAFTGEVSVLMLLESGCQYVIVGHSERRTLHGEGDALVAKKFAAARAAGLTPILCVGELLEERESGKTQEVVARQLDAVLDLEGVSGLGQSIIAYEPVWAIGTGRTATPQQAQEVHAFIRSRVAAKDPRIASQISILYGGSVKASNAAELFSMPDIDGGLIGGASLQANEFLAICNAVA
ncbi:triose-phosphate isomerase [Gammaproteobacteria bacterium]